MEWLQFLAGHRGFSPNSTFETVQDNVLGTVTHYRLGDPGLNPSRGEIFCTCPDKPLDMPSLLYSG